MKWFARNWLFVVFVALGVLQLSGTWDVNTKAIILIGLAGFPVLLPLVAKYVKKFSVGNVQGEMRWSEDAEAQAQDTYGQLSIHARRILRALWHFQLAHYGEDTNTRWGFVTGSGAPQFLSFTIGVQELQALKLVLLDARGLCYLTNAGMEFSRQYREQIDREELVYTEFAPAPE